LRRLSHPLITKKDFVGFLPAKQQLKPHIGALVGLFGLKSSTQSCVWRVFDARWCCRIYPVWCLLAVLFAVGTCGRLGLGDEFLFDGTTTGSLCIYMDLTMLWASCLPGRELAVCFASAICGLVLLRSRFSLSVTIFHLTPNSSALTRIYIRNKK